MIKFELANPDFYVRPKVRRERLLLGRKKLEDGSEALYFENQEVLTKKGKIHCDFGPAVRWKNGRIEFWQRGILHREGNLPAILGPGEIIEFWVNGRPHRDEGFAKKTQNGDLYYFQNGILHRPDGAAVIRKTGYKEYWVCGEKISEEEFFKPDFED